MTRFDQLHIGELQQLLAAVVLAKREKIFGAPGPGNLLLGLERELGEELERQIDDNS